jgi:hypothetical protein
MKLTPSRQVKKTVHTLPTEVVEKITPGSPRNPDNVQRVEFILSQVSRTDFVLLIYSATGQF